MMNYKGYEHKGILITNYPYHLLKTLQKIYKHNSSYFMHKKNYFIKTNIKYYFFEYFVDGL